MSDDKRLDRIETKVDKVLEHQAAHGETLAAQHISLKDHMRRTDILEKAVMPMVRKWDMVQGAGKLIGTMILLAGGIEGLVALLEYMSRK